MTRLKHREFCQQLAKKYNTSTFFDFRRSYFGFIFSDRIVIVKFNDKGVTIRHINKRSVVTFEHYTSEKQALVRVHFNFYFNVLKRKKYYGKYF